MIWGAPEIFVAKGNMINITCTINYSTEPPAYIFWYHHDEVSAVKIKRKTVKLFAKQKKIIYFLYMQVINFDSARGGVSVITEKADVTISHLLIQKADLADSGKYSCSPSNADVASVRVHVT